MHIAIRGTGHMARTLGGGLLAAGHDIVFGSRSPDDLTDLPAPAKDHRQAIASSEVVLNAIAGALP